MGNSRETQGTSGKSRDTQGTFRKHGNLRETQGTLGKSKETQGTLGSLGKRRELWRSMRNSRETQGSLRKHGKLKEDTRNLQGKRREVQQPKPENFIFIRNSCWRRFRGALMVSFSSVESYMCLTRHHSFLGMKKSLCRKMTCRVESVG